MHTLLKLQLLNATLEYFVIYRTYRMSTTGTMSKTRIGDIIIVFGQPGPTHEE